MKNLIIVALRIFTLTWLSAVNISLFGQSYYSGEESEKGYWQVYTDHKTKNTFVQFFDARRQLIYKETIPRKYIKLTKRNIRRFDDLLSKLESRSLLSSVVKSYDLVADSRSTLRDAFKPQMEIKEVPNYHHTKETNIYVLREGRLRIILTNPRKEYFNITILDDQLQTIYHEPVNESRYGRWFDMSKLPQGSYKIRIVSARTKLYYKLKVDDYQGYVLEDLNSL